MSQNGHIEIKIASPEDQEIVAEMFLHLLEFLDQFEHDMLPTRGNAEFITHTVFMPAAARGEPILIAWDQNKPIGGIFWPVHQLPYEARWKMAYGYGTYLKEGYRNQKLGTQLRHRALKILRSLNVQRLMGMVHTKNKISLKASQGFGFVPFARLDLLNIEAHATPHPSGDENL